MLANCWNFSTIICVVDDDGEFLGYLKQGLKADAENRTAFESLTKQIDDVVAGVAVRLKDDTATLAEFEAAKKQAIAA